MELNLDGIRNRFILAKLNNRVNTPPGFLLVSGVIVAILILMPLIYLIIRASTGNFFDLLLKPQTLAGAFNTLILAGSVTLATVALAVPLAWITSRTDVPFRKTVSVLLVLPLVIPSLVGAFSFVSALGYGGALSIILDRFLGISYSANIYGFFGAWVVLTLLTYPYVLLTVRGSLSGMDQSQEEVGRTLGKSTWLVFWSVTLPQLKPSIAAGALLVALYTISDFAAVSILQYDSFTRIIYLQYQSSFDREYASVLSSVLVFITFIIVSTESIFRSKSPYFRTGMGTGKRVRLINLGRWKWAALLYCILVIALALILPIGINLFWVINGLFQGEELFFRPEAIFNSLYVSLLASGAGIVAGLPIVLLSVRYRSRLTLLLEKVAYAGYALPGIVVALSLVFFGANYASFLYQSIIILVIAYVILFLPQALGSLRSSLLQVSPNIEEAGLLLGCSKAYVLWKIILPVIGPGIISGAALVFLTAMKELPATLLLSPIGFRTLTTEIWNATIEAFYMRAAVPSLLLIVASSLSLWIFLKYEKAG